MASVQTIAAISTPFGRSAIAVIRISGPNTLKIVETYLSKRLKPRNATNCRIYDDQNKAIDDIIAIFYTSPNSFTGEDMLEIQCHGNPAILNYIMLVVCKTYARQSNPGEFTERAFMNNKIDLIQAEAIADIINASNVSASTAAMLSLQGNFSKKINDVIAKVLSLRARIEASINFPEDDTPEISCKENRVDYNVICIALENIINSTIIGIKINQNPNITIVGKPNVGKSSLANLLLGESRSIVSEIPGTTRDALYTELSLDKANVTIIDTAGLRKTDDPIELEGIKITKRSIEQSTLVLYVVDSTIGFSDDDKELILENKIDNYWLIYNKTDLTPNSEYSHAGDRGIVFYISSLTGKGINVLKKQLVNRSITDDETAGTARARHLDLLKSTLENLYLSAKYNDNYQLELAAEELRRSHNLLASIIGSDVDEDLLDKIFSEFCIGK